jgi:hypothetical protein
LGLYLVGSLIICVRLRASSLDCRMAGVLSMSQFRSPSSTSSEDRWGQSIHIRYRGHSWGQREVREATLTPSAGNTGAGHPDTDS